MSIDAQWYVADQEVRIFDGTATITIRFAEPQTRVSVNAVLRRFGYRPGPWLKRDWGKESKLAR